MMIRHFLISMLSGIMALIVLSAGAQANITAISISPSSRNIAANAPASFTINWRLTRNGSVGSTTVQSTQYVIRLASSNGSILRTVSKSLSQTRIVTNNIEFFTFAETIRIPRDVVYRATKAGQKLIVQRVFTDDNFNNTLTGELPVNMGGASSGDFSITRIELAFDDDSTACNAKTGKDRTAIATISANGTGLLRGSWRVREGSGVNSFRTLRTVQVPISAGRETRVQSPPLPVGSGGERLDVRLVVDEPAIDFETPTITCGITGQDTLLKHKGDTNNLAKLLSPAPNSPLAADTEIKWEAVKGAKSYRIEILAEQDGEPITAQLVKASQTSAKPSPLTLDKLEASARYTVRVVSE